MEPPAAQTHTCTIYREERYIYIYIRTRVSAAVVHTHYGRRRPLNYTAGAAYQIELTRANARASVCRFIIIAMMHRLIARARKTRLFAFAKRRVKGEMRDGDCDDEFPML